MRYFSLYNIKTIANILYKMGGHSSKILTTIDDLPASLYKIELARAKHEINDQYDSNTSTIYFPQYESCRIYIWMEGRDIKYFAQVERGLMASWAHIAKNLFSDHIFLWGELYTQLRIISRHLLLFSRSSFGITMFTLGFLFWNIYR